MKQYLSSQFYDDLIYFYDLYPHSVQGAVQRGREEDPIKIFEYAVYCFLTPATKSHAADITCRELFSTNDFFSLSKEEVTEILRKPPYIRFHNQKTERILLWRTHGFDIIESLNGISEPFDKREFLVEHVRGMNYKEASHFLRNIGQSGSLVILDRHILSFMKKIEVISENETMASLSRNYKKHEMLFQEFIRSDLWISPVSDLTQEIPRADFAVWAAGVKRSNPDISYERILELK